MLCTVVWDQYRSHEREAVWRALRALVPNGGPDWSPKGVYAYWDPAERRLLYVGLASDLAERFAQHNGLVSHAGGNKREQIDEWFGQHDTLGFTVVLQSAAIALMDAIHEVSRTLAVPASEVVASAEGQLIELHRLAFGERPPWNGVGGSTLGAKWAKASEQSMIPVLAATQSNLFVARRTLRELASDERAKVYEAALHSARMRVLIDSHDVYEIPQAEDKVDAMLRLLMLRSGHLMDDLSGADELIVRQLERLSDVEVLQQEVRAHVEDVEKLAHLMKLPEDRQALSIAAGAIAEAPLIEQAETIRQLLEQDYLSSGPDI